MFYLRNIDVILVKYGARGLRRCFGCEKRRALMENGKMENGKWKVVTILSSHYKQGFIVQGGENSLSLASLDSSL